MVLIYADGVLFAESNTDRRKSEKKKDIVQLIQAVHILGNEKYHHR